MFELVVKERFESAHHIKGHSGKCANPHGHSYRVEVHFLSQSVDHLGISCDFSILRKYVLEVTNQLDHKDLNTLPYFKNLNPTAETIAKYVYKELLPCSKSENIQLKKVVLWETDNYCAVYYE